jgi:hypothetical protein
MSGPKVQIRATLTRPEKHHRRSRQSQASDSYSDSDLLSSSAGKQRVEEGKDQQQQLRTKDSQTKDSCSPERLPGPMQRPIPPVAKPIATLPKVVLPTLSNKESSNSQHEPKPQPKSKAKRVSNQRNLFPGQSPPW